MKTLTREKHIASVPSRWKKQYGYGHWLNHKDKQDIQNKLDKTLPCKEEFDKIIGNSSWTSLECNSCGKDVEIVVFVKSRGSEEYGESAFCKECLERYLKIINQDARSGQGETGEHLTTAPNGAIESAPFCRRSAAVHTGMKDGGCVYCSYCGIKL